MANSGIEATEIFNLATGTEVVASDSGNVAGIVIPRRSIATGPFKWLEPDTPVDPYTLDLSGYAFDALATNLDPCDIEVAFGVGVGNSVTVQLSGSDFTRYNNNEITVTGVSAAWNPDNDDGNGTFFTPNFIFDASITGSIVETGGNLTTWNRVDGTGNPQTGGITLVPASSHPIQTTPTYDSFNRLIDLPSVGDGNAGPLEFSSGAQNVRSLALILSIGSTSGASPIAPTTSSDFSQWDAGGSGPLTDIFDSQYSDVETAWDGEIKGTAGSEVVEFESAVANDLWYRNEQGGAQSRPAVDQVFVVILREPGNNIPWQFIGARWNSLWQRTGPMKVHCVLGWSTYINDDYALLLQQWLCWKAFNEGWTPTLLLPDTGEGDLGLKHPYRDSPAGGAGVPIISVISPQVTLTISNIPAGGIFTIWDDENPDSQDLGTSLQVTDPTDGNNITYQGTGGNLIVLQFVPNTGDSVNYQESNINFTFPNSDQTLDFSQFLEIEDSL